MAGIHVFAMESLPYFTNKRGTYGIIADGLRFATQLSNVYGNAIRAKLAAAQTTRPMPKAVFVSPVCGKAKEKSRTFLQRTTLERH